MVITRVQKSGRIDGSYPSDDARIIDQFMDDVILAIEQTESSVNDIDDEIILVQTNNFICKIISKDVTIPSDKVLLQRETVIENGVVVTIDSVCSIAKITSSMNWSIIRASSEG